MPVPVTVPAKKLPKAPVALLAMYKSLLMETDDAAIVDVEVLERMALPELPAGTVTVKATVEGVPLL